MKILQDPDARLREVADPVTAEEAASPEFAERVRDLAKTLVESGGWALAATQVGWKKRVVISVHPTQLAEIGSRTDRAIGQWQIEFMALLNPRIVAVRGGRTPSPEACLSFRGAGSEDLMGYDDVDVEADGTETEPKFLHHVGKIRYISLAARMAQHEIGHLDGHLMTDRMGNLQRKLFLKRLATAQKKAARAS